MKLILYLVATFFLAGLSAGFRTAGNFWGDFTAFSLMSFFAYMSGREISDRNAR
jgi:hypothetical protein